MDFEEEVSSVQGRVNKTMFKNPNTRTEGTNMSDRVKGEPSTRRLHVRANLSQDSQITNFQSSYGSRWNPPHDSFR